MENALNNLAIELLSQPLIQMFVIIGAIGLIFYIVKNPKQYAYYFISIFLILLFGGVFGNSVTVEQNNVITSEQSKGFTIFTIILVGIIMITIIFVLCKILKGSRTTNHNSYNENHIEEMVYELPEFKLCPKCGGILREKRGKYGRFYGCSNYPRCKYTQKISEYETSKNATEMQEIENINVNSLKNKLIEFRKATAKEKNIPAYYVFNNNELEKILEIKPRSIQELRDSGILADVKIRTHGQKIIEIINNC